MATFNVLGFSDHAKWYDVAKDYYNYNIDILQFKRLSELNEKTICTLTFVVKSTNIV